MARLEPYFPKCHGKPRVDDRRVSSGIVFVNRNGLRWCDAPREYGPHKTLYNRWKRWGERGVFLRIMEGLAAASATPKTIMIDATYLKAHRTASSLRVRRGPWAPHRSHQRRYEYEGSPERVEGLRAVTDAEGRPFSFFMTAGQVSDYTGAAALLDDLPKAQWMLGDRGYDADWDRDALQAKGITPCIPGRKSRIIPVKYDKRRYRSRSRIEIMFGRLKDWRRVATRYDRCPTVFFSAIALAATVIFWL
jgi:transposase